MTLMVRFGWAVPAATFVSFYRPSRRRLLSVLVVSVQCALAGAQDHEATKSPTVLVHKPTANSHIDAVTAATFDNFCAAFSKTLPERLDESSGVSPWVFSICLRDHETRGRARISVSAKAGNVTVQVGTVRPKDALKQIAALVRRSVAVSRDPYLRAFVMGNDPAMAVQSQGTSKR